MVVTRYASVRTRCIVISAISAVLALFSLANTSGHERLNLLHHLPEMSPLDLGGKRRYRGIREIHTTRTVLRAIPRLTPA